ncbi:MAG: transcriptional regulator [Planctomycetes bacterium RBG_13_62_9]|nr:MAG: transcriptional regulator [Planctomycetes bacterium RBG_13_62_9]
MTPSELTRLVRELLRLPSETEWAEFKYNKAVPDEIGETVSAISNSVALVGRSCGYFVWGIDDKTHKIAGTAFLPRQTRVGNEELENWLLRLLEPSVDFHIYEDEIDGKRVVLFEIPSAPNRPVRFRDTEYIRVGSYTKKLRDFPEKERALWRIFDQVPFEEGIAKENASADEVLDIIDYPKYFQLMQPPLPDNRTAILARMSSESIVRPQPSGSYHMTNVGAVLFARNLTGFRRLARKALRVIIYKGHNRTNTIREQTGAKGYAVGFEGAIRFINDQLPQNEEIGQALRREVRMYPEIAIRELIANALIHQDLNITGAGPTVEIFADRMEITNPGVPLIDTLRFIDEPPRSRNETLAAFMRRVAICEERGSGIDKVIFNVEMFQLPAPDFRVAGTSTVAVLYGPRGFSEMNRDERVRACYQHACLQYVSGTKMSNASLRKRLGIKESNYPMASRIIRDAITAELIRPAGEGITSKRDATYVPFWA